MMKLILCRECQDVVRLVETGRRCRCGAIWGRYEADGYHAEISENAVAIGFANSTLREALENIPERGWGKEFTAFVIEHECPTIRRLTADEVSTRQNTEDERKAVSQLIGRLEHGTGS